nr:hypothetical protein [Tanacetum cinerariifolium]
MQAYYATNELPIPPPPAHIAPPPSPVLSPQFDPQDFFLPEEILPPQKQARFLSHSFSDLCFDFSRLVSDGNLDDDLSISLS